MRKRLATLLVTAAAVMAMSNIVFAGTWKEDQSGWYWEEGNGSYPVSSWEWLDGNQDNIAECYYFDGQGYLLTDTTTPDGYQVDAEGRWIVDGVIQTRSEGRDSADLRQIYQDAVGRTTGLASYEAKLRFEVPDSGYSNMVMDVDIKTHGKKSSKAAYMLNVSAVIEDTQLSGNLFYSEGYCYFKYDFEGQYYSSWEKQEMQPDEIDQFFTTMISGMFMESRDLADIELISVENGNQKMAYRADIERISEDGYMDNLYLYGMDIKELTGTIVINPDGYILENDMLIRVDEGDVVSDMKLQTRYMNPGQYVYFNHPFM